MNIGVFDSGKGGLSVANTICTAFPGHQVEFVNDAAHLPYGGKTKAQLLEFSLPVLSKLAVRCDVIVIACNSLTTNLITELRRKLPVPLVGIEPMVKPAAALTENRVIAVCATPATLASERYEYLKATYANGIAVLEPDCSDWASMIEADEVSRELITGRIEAVCERGADVIVLGCTHYHWIENLIREIANGRAIVLQPEQAVLKRLWRVLYQIETKKREL